MINYILYSFPSFFSGLILYAAQDKFAGNGGGDFVSFGLRSGVPEFRFSLGSGGAAVIRGRKAISFGQWHKAKISRHVINVFRSQNCWDYGPPPLSSLLANSRNLPN